MNRDDIAPGKTYGKWAESYALFGGIGAFVYPLTFYYVGYVAIDERWNHLLCTATEEAAKELAGEDYEDWIRFTMLWNCNMMSIYLILHFILFSRPESYNRFQRLGVIFSIILCFEVVFALVNFILIGNSICNDDDYATSGILSSIVIIVVNLFTVIGSSIFFFIKTRTRTSQINVEV